MVPVVRKFPELTLPVVLSVPAVILPNTATPVDVNTATFAVPPIEIFALPPLARVILVLPLTSSVPAPAITFDKNPPSPK